jgi:hypothetical protein
MKICFYTSSEKIQMVELLVQILYKNEAETVACNWDLPRLFDILEFFLGSDSKLLIERSLLLIFNLNIDRGSTIFLIHRKPSNTQPAWNKWLQRCRTKTCP